MKAKLSLEEARRKKKRGDVPRECARCGAEFVGHGNARYCGCAAVRPAVELSHWQVWKGSVLRGRRIKKAFANRDLIRLSEVEFNSVAGLCFYCGGAGFGLTKRDLEGVWELGNVICCCGVCGGMKRGLGHVEFLGQVNRIVKNNNEE